MKMNKRKINDQYRNIAMREKQGNKKKRRTTRKHVARKQKLSVNQEEENIGKKM